MNFLNKNSTLRGKPKIVTLCLQKQPKLMKKVEENTFANAKLSNYQCL